ncbi:MAG: CotS family spore coat protein [Clostridium sp.]
MVYERIREQIEKNYSLNITSIEKVKSAFKITAREGRYCLKCVKYQYPHFYFIQEAMKHLLKNEFYNVPEIMKTYSGLDYIKLDEGYAYITKWINSRESNYNNPLELKRVSGGLADLHLKSRGFIINRDMNPRIGWFSWIEVFSTRNKEIYDFKKRISQKAILDEFDNMYLNAIDKEIKRGEKAIDGLKNNNYLGIMKKEVLTLGFCHHDMANHNILVDDKNNLNFIDFDYCILDSHLHDLSSLIIRALKNGKWDNQKADVVLQGYNEKYRINSNELKIMKEFIRYPQAFWQVGLQRYWEQQPWDMNKFINRITSYLEDCDEREEFIDSYFNGGD